MKNLIAAASLVIAATGCATTPPPVVQQTTEYQFEDAAWAREEGTATVTGAAMVRLKNGQVLHCGALEVAMIPVTDYTFERAQLIYGQSEKIQVSHTADIFSAGPSGVNLEAVHPTDAQDRLVSVCEWAKPCRPVAIGPMDLSVSAFAQLAGAQARRSLNLKRTNP